jgi:hypothetical protein
VSSLFDSSEWISLILVTTVTRNFLVFDTKYLLKLSAASGGVRAFPSYLIWFGPLLSLPDISPTRQRTYHCKIRISTHGRFKLLLLQWLYFLLGAHIFWRRQAMLPNYFDMRPGEWTLQLNCNQLCWETSNTEKGQKRPKIATEGRNFASLLLWLFWPVGGHNFWMSHSICLLVRPISQHFLLHWCAIMPTFGARTKSSEWYVLCFRGSWIDKQKVLPDVFSWSIKEHHICGNFQNCNIYIR